MENKRLNLKNTFLYGAGLIGICLAINLLLSFLARLIDPSVFPLYLDNVGTFLATMIGGALPGVIVGFLTNLINSFFTYPIMLYYGTVSVLLALAVRWLFTKGFFKKIPKILLSILALTLISGVIGAILTRLIYGYDFGSEISAPLARRIYGSGVFSPFFAQLSADLIINLADKSITLAAALIVYRFMPRKIVDLFPFSTPAKMKKGSTSVFTKGSLLRKVVVTMLAFELALCTLVGLICYYMYKETVIERYTETCVSAVDIAIDLIDAGNVDRYIAEREKNVQGFLAAHSDEEEGTEAYFDAYAEYARAHYSAEYLKIEKSLKNIVESVPDLEYLYVYQIRTDGCHVVFDADSQAVDTFVPFDDSFSKLIPTLLAGGKIDPIITDDTYGWLLTVYEPLSDDDGVCRAYVCADISMHELEVAQIVFLSKVITLLIGTSIIVLAFVLWFAQLRLVEPINTMSEAASEFAFESEEKRQHGVSRLRELQIGGSDEIAHLYQSLIKLASDSTDYIEKIRRDAETIAQMQEGIILDFANMVESRDENTGNHIKKTSLYVKLIAEELRREGYYTEILTDEYIACIVRSAPLHDVGKIKISDTLLNKPGRLTDEEFAIMRTHTVEGRNILSEALVNTTASDYLEEAINMAYCHHEWWNGKGYPQGLSGEQIPLSARIMAVADVFDALISKRSYKQPFPFEKAIAIIREESGTHFDPKVAGAFLAISPQFENDDHS